MGVHLLQTWIYYFPKIEVALKTTFRAFSHQGSRLSIEPIWNWILLNYCRISEEILFETYYSYYRNFQLITRGNLLIFPQTVVVVGNTIILKASGIVLKPNAGNNRDSKIHSRYSSKNLCKMLFMIKADANRKHTKLDHKAFLLPCQFHSLILCLVQKTILTYTGSELENKII